MLDDVLLPSSGAASSGPAGNLKTFALCGLGRISKTRIALEFALTRKHNFDAVFFVRADSESKLAESFNNIAPKLGLSDEADVENRVVNRDRVLE